MFTLMSAACLLGLKYKMTAHKITIAVREHTLVNRASYKQIVHRFLIIFAVCFIYFAYSVIVTIGIESSKDWPYFLYNIGSGIAFTFIIVLFITFLQSFSEMKDALRQHTSSEAVSMKVQVFYLMFLTFIAVISLIMSLVNVFYVWGQIISASDNLCRIIG
jgi:hypothetical protein